MSQFGQDQPTTKAVCMMASHQHPNETISDIAKEALPVLERYLLDKYHMTIDIGMELECALKPTDAICDAVEKYRELPGDSENPFYITDKKHVKERNYGASCNSVYPSKLFCDSAFVSHVYLETAANVGEFLPVELVFGHEAINAQETSKNGKAYCLAKGVEDIKEALTQAALSNQAHINKLVSEDDVRILRHGEAPQCHDIIIRNIDEVSFNSYHMPGRIKQGLHVNVSLKMENGENFFGANSAVARFMDPYIREMCVAGRGLFCTSKEAITRMGILNMIPTGAVEVKSTYVEHTLYGADADPYQAAMCSIAGMIHALENWPKLKENSGNMPVLKTPHFKTTREGLESFDSHNILVETLNCAEKGLGDRFRAATQREMGALKQVG